MTELKTDFNVSPYYDDYDEDKNFHRILYRPATALQARELTQMQTILQDQIGRAGRFVHAEGAIVEGSYAIYSGIDFSGTGENLKKRLEFVRVDDTFLKLGNTTSVAVNNNLEVLYSSNHSVNSASYTSDGANIASFNADKERDGSYIVGATTGIIKRVFYYQNGLESQFPNTNVLFTLSQVDGINDGNTVTYKTFQKDETLYAFTDLANAESFRAQVVAGNTASDVANNSFASIKVYNDASNPSREAVGGAMGVATTEGVIFSRGHFVRVDPQRVVVVPFDDVTPPAKYVGFRIDESIITPELDDSLYDNAAGSSNENAPGAHRLKLTGVLFASSETPANNFASLLTTAAETGAVQTTRELPALNEDGLGAVVAASLKDSAGDYVIGQPKLIFNSISGNTTHANVQINPAPGGTTYFVNGKRSHHIGTSYVDVRRGTDTIEEENVRTTINYGRYLKVNEFAGDIKFDKYPKVYFVNTDITAITSGTYAFTDAAALSGSIIGNTTLLSVAHDTGTKGTPEATFKLYVDDIKLATGNKISDVAGIMICDGTDPDPNNAVGFASLANTTVFELDTAGLVFDTGLPALKQFSIDSAPGTDTEYTALHRRSAVAMDVNGIVSFNIVNATGSTDQPNEQGNPVGDTNEINYTLVPTANIITSNSSIDCAVSTSANTITIASGTPSDYLVVGDCLEVFDTGSSEYFRIEEIDGTTLTVNATPGFTNAAAKFCRFIPHGVPISLAGSSSNVVANSSTVIINTRFGNLGGAVSVQTPATTDVIYNKLRTEITSPLGKDINKNKYVILDCSNNVSGTTGPWDLGLSDVHRIRKVYVGGTLAANVSDLSSMTDRTSKFTLDSGQRDTKYDHGRLKIAIGSNFALDSGDKIVVELDHFTANSSAGEGFYNVESYPISASDPSSANSTTILTAEIPVFRSPTTGKYYDLRNCIDFRPRVEDTATSSSTLSGATTNPAASDVIELPSGTSSSYISAPSEPFDADVTYYVGRQDAISYDGRNFIVSEGTPTKYAKTPEPNIPSGTMPLSFVKVPPYPSLTNNETILPEIPNTARRESYFKHRVVTNRRYTMKDIGVLAQRISKLEYYVSLNMLEKSANELNISDDAGLNRFKNGIFVDPFTGHELADTTGFNGIHKVSIDQRQYHMRPTFTQSTVDLDYIPEESGCKQWQGVITLPLDTTQGTNGHVTFSEVTVASKSRNVCDTIGEALGEMYLCPNFDGSAELEGDKGVVNLDIDLAQALEPLTELPFYGSFVNQGAASSVTTSTNRVVGGNRVNTTTTVTTQAQVRDVYNLSMDVTETTAEINNIIQDVSFDQYIRPQYVSFLAFGLLPNSRLHFFFDDELVDDLIQPGEMNGDVYPSIAANPNRIAPSEGIDPSNRDSVEATGEIGQAIFANDQGCAYGILHIPAQRFFQGERKLVIKEFPDLNSTSRFRAEARFLSYGLGYKATDFSMTAIVPEFTVNTSQETRIIQGTVISQTVTPIPPPPPVDTGDGGDGGDPLAMTFIVPNGKLARDIDPGVFMTEVDIYFRSKSPTKGLRVTLYETSPFSAYPDLSKPLEGSTFRLESDDVVVDGNINGPVNATTFQFPRPVFIAKDKVYALMVFPDQFDGDYSIWCARAGDQDVTTGKTISLADSGNGTLFRSKNEKVWSPVIEETFTFAMRRAAFDNSATRTAVFKNKPVNYTNIDTITLANTARPVIINDYIIGIGDDTKRGKVRYLRESTGNLIFNQVTTEFVANDEIEFVRFTSMLDDDGNKTGNINLANLAQSTYDSIGNTIITSVNDVPAHAVVLQMATIQPSGTTINSKFRGMSNNYAIDTSFLDMPLEDELEFSLLEGGAQSRIVASRSNEIGQAASNTSMEINTFLYSPSSGTSPLIDMRRKDVLTITNQINNTTALESTNDGLATSRYLSRTIELADGQDAEDLEVYITAYRPPLTDIVVYAKLLSGSDPGLFEDKSWTKLTRVTDGAITSADQFDIKEYRYQIPTSLSTDTYANGDSFSVTSSAYIAPENPSDDLEDDIVTYTDDEGVVYQRFKYFAIKIVLNTSSAEIVPHVKDLRAIALQR